jgi:phosphomannomutase
MDGLKVNYEDGWYHVRLSNTEPVYRIVAEAISEERAYQLLEAARKVASSLAGSS